MARPPPKLTILACKKDLSHQEITITDNTDFATTISTSVSGFVNDENNAPAQNATVTAGNKTAVTNQYGYFKIENAMLVKNAALVTVSKTGYYKGIKTYSATEGKTAFFRIKLIPETLSGSFNATAGGTVTVASGLIVSLPANAVVNASTNAAYSGTVNVFSYFIDPLSPDLNNIMPGDQRGIDIAGALKGLTTYGMAAVELRGASGEKLQISSGKKATLSFPLAGNILAAAPASIPLWYLDESTGLWKQEGTAAKTGNTYSGDVSHFSYWNCDLPNAIVPLTFTVVNAAGLPLSDIHVEITPTTLNSWSHIGGYTDASGYVSVFVTPNASYHLVLTSNSYGCSSALYIQDFSVTTMPVNLGNLVTGTVNNTYTITGNVIDCNNNPVIDGTIFLQNAFYYSAYPVSSSGTFNISYYSCNTQPLNLIAVNNLTLEQSIVFAYAVSPGLNNLGNIQACGSTTSEYIQYNYDGAQHSLTTPGNYVYQYRSGNNDFISGYGQSSDHANFNYTNTGVSAGTDQLLGGLSLGSSLDSLVAGPGSTVHITEYGNIGEYIKGNFFIVAHKYTDPTVTHNIIAQFRVKRGS